MPVRRFRCIVQGPQQPALVEPNTIELNQPFLTPVSGEDAAGAVSPVAPQHFVVPPSVLERMAQMRSPFLACIGADESKEKQSTLTRPAVPVPVSSLAQGSPKDSGCRGKLRQVSDRHAHALTEEMESVLCEQRRAELGLESTPAPKHVTHNSSIASAATATATAGGAGTHPNPEASPFFPGVSEEFIRFDQTDRLSSRSSSVGTAGDSRSSTHTTSSADQRPPQHPRPGRRRRRWGGGRGSRQFNERDLDGFHEAGLREDECLLLSSSTSDGSRRDSEGERNRLTPSSSSSAEEAEDKQEEQEEEEEKEFTEEDEDDGVPSSSVSSGSMASAVTDVDEEVRPSARGGGFGLFDRQRRPQAERSLRPSPRPKPCLFTPSIPSSPTAPTTGPRRRFGAVSFTTHINAHAATPCHHSLMALHGALTLRGPCALLGLGVGEATLNGTFLGRRWRVLPTLRERAVLMPVGRSKVEHETFAPAKFQQNVQEAVHELDRAPMPCERRAKKITATRTNRAQLLLVDAAQGTLMPPGGRGDTAEADGGPSSCPFGAVDWDWVEACLQGWLELFAGQLPVVVLVVQPYDAARGAGVRRHYLHGGGGGRRGDGKRRRRLEADWLRTATAEERARHAAGGAEAFIEVPAFLARHADTTAVVDAALMPTVVPGIVRRGRGSVVVLGGEGIGKSTLCRFLANALYSRHGRCLWLELDLGQPEFEVAGQLALYRLRRPLARAHDTAAVALLRANFLGSPTLQCPLSTARALAQLCELARRLAESHPVVVNTHGWVLQTGRRLTIEAIRRLLPRVVVHLVRPDEEAWAKDTDALMDPIHGLNAAVLATRFLVPRPVPQRKKNQSNLSERKQPPPKDDAEHDDMEEDDAFLGKLPHPFPPDSRRSGRAEPWTGVVHTVRVARAPAENKAKGRQARQALWEAHLQFLLAHYQGTSAESSDRTVCLRGPLEALHQVVLVDRDEKEGAVQLGPISIAGSSLGVGELRRRPGVAPGRGVAGEAGVAGPL